MTTLYMSASTSNDHQRLWRAATTRDWAVERIRGITIDRFTTGDIAAYFEPLYAPTLCKQLNIRLLEPDEGWLTRVPQSFTQRRIELTTADAARSMAGPIFVKPPNDKSFEASVIQSGNDLAHHVEGSSSVLVSEPVQFVHEWRCFILDGHVKTLSPYIWDGNLASAFDYAAPASERSAAQAFVESLLAIDKELPRAIVVDVGQLSDGSWAVVEANGAWGAGLYGCDAGECLDVIHAATERV